MAARERSAFGFSAKCLGCLNTLSFGVSSNLIFCVLFVIANACNKRSMNTRRGCVPRVNAIVFGPSSLFLMSARSIHYDCRIFCEATNVLSFPLIDEVVLFYFDMYYLTAILKLVFLPYTLKRWNTWTRPYAFLTGRTIVFSAMPAQPVLRLLSEHRQHTCRTLAFMVCCW